MKIHIWGTLWYQDNAIMFFWLMFETGEIRAWRMNEDNPKEPWKFSRYHALHGDFAAESPFPTKNPLAKPKGLNGCWMLLA